MNLESSREVKELGFEDDFDIFENISFFDDRFIRKLQLRLNEIMEEVKNGKMQGKFEVRQFDQPGIKGYFIQGRFGTDESLEPIEPLKPSKRRPSPENPFEIPDGAHDEIREPLTDVFEEEEAIKIYAELPGEERNDIKLKITENKVEIKAKNFHKVIDLPKRNIATEGVSSEYKNGVLEITVPKKKELRWTDKSKAKMV